MLIVWIWMSDNWVKNSLSAYSVDGLIIKLWKLCEDIAWVAQVKKGYGCFDYEVFLWTEMSGGKSLDPMKLFQELMNYK